MTMSFFSLAFFFSPSEAPRKRKSCVKLIVLVMVAYALDHLRTRWWGSIWKDMKKSREKGGAERFVFALPFLFPLLSSRCCVGWANAILLL